MSGLNVMEDTIDEVDVEVRPRGLLTSLPFFEERIDPVLIFLVVLSGCLIFLLSIKFHIFNLWIEFLNSNTFLRLSTYPLLASGAVIIGGLVFHTVYWMRYRPMTIKPDEKIDWPNISVIMPALNEEELVAKSIDSIFRSDYPKDRLEVICINDGSTDRTYEHMLQAKQKHGQNLKVINFQKNLGKRRAFYAGLKKSRGDILVSVDTDSKIGRSALKNLMIPLIKDKTTGAVAGRVAVLNEKENFLTRMLSVRYSLSFDFGRAYQSVYGSVFVCPGALTAYRKDLLKRFVHDWLNQKFLNAQCRLGEDRALTTQILKTGHLTRYQSNAVVYTKIPSTFRQMNKMYLRWTRSYIRESVIFARFMFSSYRKKNRALPILDFFFLNLLHPFHLFSLALIIYSFVINPLFILRHMAFLVLSAFFLSLYYLRTNKSLTFLYGIPYAIITAFFLWWIVPFSLITIKNQSWMTR